MSALPGSDVPMTTEELRDTLGALITGHSRHDSTDWDLNSAMRAVEDHVAYRTSDTRLSVLREVRDRLKTEALRTASEPRYQTIVWIVRLLDELAAEQTPPIEGDHVT
ncbi:hypothetical protein ADL27_14255 [Streptomyces sp. NRRL F-6602]|nr:hypothetical protein ADL27_14255 [Streptomyces sp. NRRL F-6602]